MKLIETHKLKPDTFEGKETEKHWTYCGLDCCLTIEIFDAIHPQLDNVTNNTYRFSMDLMGPVFEMALRGVLVDDEERNKAIALYETDLQHVVGNLNTILIDGLGLTINWNSPAQIKHLLYEVIGLPVVKKRNSKGEYAPTVERDALEKLADGYFVARPIINHILAARDIKKKIGVLNTEIDDDKRLRTSYNIGGTTTGRLSSSLSDFGTGGNFQNIEERLRRVFIADPGMKLAYIDLEQAESRAVGAIIWNLFHDGRYLDACESADLHVSVSKISSPDLPWTDDPVRDREIANQPFGDSTIRQVNKVLGHSTNYYGQPPTVSKHTGIAIPVVKAFQAKYIPAFGLDKWWAHVERTIRDEGKLTTLTGRRRYFFGRRNDATTIREAIAYDPQGSVADILNTGMLKVWRSRLCELLAQIHDAILVQYPEEKEDEILPQLLEIIKVPIELSYGRTLLIPSEAQTGWNWSKMVAPKDQEKARLRGDPIPPLNPDGLIKYHGHDNRTRTKTPILDRLVY